MLHPRLLRTFLAVACHRTVTRAAEAVHLAQSSVSEQIQALEVELGTSLFARSKRGLALTAAGLALQPYAEEILASMDDAAAAVRTAADQLGRSITVGALETIAATRLPRWLAQLQDKQADLTISLKIAGSGELLHLLGDGVIDAAFCFDRGSLDPRLAKKPVSAEPLILIAPPGEHRASAMDMGALSAMNFVATEPGCIYRHLFAEAFAQVGVAPNIVAEAGSVGAIAGLVAAGMGSALVPKLAVAEALRREDIIEMPWPGTIKAASLILVWRRRRILPPALRLLIAAVGDGFGSLKPADAHPPHAEQSRW